MRLILHPLMAMLLVLLVGECSTAFFGSPIWSPSSHVVDVESLTDGEFMNSPVDTISEADAVPLSRFRNLPESYHARRAVVLHSDRNSNAPSTRHGYAIVAKYAREGKQLDTLWLFDPQQKRYFQVQGLPKPSHGITRYEISLTVSGQDGRYALVWIQGESKRNNTQKTAWLVIGTVGLSSRRFNNLGTFHFPAQHIKYCWRDDRTALLWMQLGKKNVISLVDLQKGKLERVFEENTTTQHTYIEDALLNSDGKYIAFSRFRSSTSRGKYGVWLVVVKKRKGEQLTYESSANYHHPLVGWEVGSSTELLISRSFKLPGCSEDYEAYRITVR
jgi:hypothetical protein